MSVQSIPAIARKSGVRDRDGVVAALAEAFHDDPVFRWASPHDERRRAILPDFFALAVDAFAQHDQTWCTGDGVWGAAVWAPPGVEPMTEADGAEFVTRCTDLAGPDAARWLELISLFEEHHPRHSDHHYLWFLGVRPARQGRGYGSALLRAVLDDADRTGAPAYLEATSADNCRLYRRHGFRVIGELGAPGGPPVWAMWREPSPST
jgi:GNAT superfamily N-acetyltransferase